MAEEQALPREQARGNAVEIDDIESGGAPKPRNHRSSFMDHVRQVNVGSKEFIKKRSTALARSTLKFEDISFFVGKPSDEQKILSNVTGKINHGHTLAVMGPSGAGKTTLISALTLDAFYGKPVGTVTLNGVPLNGDLFKKHCFVVKQRDKHWPWLTARETLQYAAGLFQVTTPDQVPQLVDGLITKLGLQICADTRCIRLSGGQRRRLSIAVALLKQPTILFLDEPTSGLDAAAASNIMQEITRVAKDEHLIVLCTIHQPSTKVYHGFDEIMVLSRGRQAYSGPSDATPKKQGAVEYFSSIGHPLPPATNPADHFLDLVNSDFSSEEEVEKILDEWDVHEKAETSTQNDDEDGIDDNFEPTSLNKEVGIMFSRHMTLVVRDPILYLGRCGVFLVMNLIFGFVYWNARDNTEEQMYTKMWIQLWFIGVPANMGVVAVYVLNDEFKSIQRERQNGMSRVSTYILAKTLLVLPIFFIFALFALVIPSFVIMDVPWKIFGTLVLLYAAIMFVFESVAELLSVAFEDPILGMMQFMSFWFMSFLFGGFLISLDDLYWPFKLFYYIMPFGYYIRSMMYLVATETDWEGDLTGGEVLDTLHEVFPVIENEDRVWQDIFTLLAIGVVWKIGYIVLVIVTSSRVTPIHAADGKKDS